MPSANPTPHPLDAAARDELDALLDEYTAAVADMTRLELNLALVPAKQRGDAFRRAQTARLALLASVRGAEADSKRLDWMQEHAADVEAVMDMDPEAEVGFRVRCYETLDMGEGPTLRAAIDAARAHPPTTETDDAE